MGKHHNPPSQHLAQNPGVLNELTAVHAIFIQLARNRDELLRAADVAGEVSHHEYCVSER